MLDSKWVHKVSTPSNNYANKNEQNEKCLQVHMCRTRSLDLHINKIILF
jgi:hypothetical protein